MFKSILVNDIGGEYAFNHYIAALAIRFMVEGKSMFPVPLSRVRAVDFLEHALELPANSCVEVSVESGQVHVSKPKQLDKDSTVMVDIDTHIGFLHSCQINDWSGYHTRVDGCIEVDISYMDDETIGEKGEYFDNCNIMGRDDIWIAMEGILDLDELHEAHVLMKRLDKLKEISNVPSEPDIVSKHSQSMHTTKASDLMHLAMTVNKQWCAPVYMNPEDRSIEIIGLRDGDSLDKPVDLTTILEHIHNAKNYVTATSRDNHRLSKYESSLEQFLDDDELLKILDKIKIEINQEKILKRLSSTRKLLLGNIPGCDIEDWSGFTRSNDDLVWYRGVKISISRAYEEICKSNPRCEVNQIMNMIEQVRQSFNMNST